MQVVMCRYEKTAFKTLPSERNDRADGCMWVNFSLFLQGEILPLGLTTLPHLWMNSLSLLLSYKNFVFVACFFASEEAEGGSRGKPKSVSLFFLINKCIDYFNHYKYSYRCPSTKCQATNNNKIFLNKC